MRQFKINKLQTEINELKAARMYDSTCDFVYDNIKWFYDDLSELKREIISADMIYECTEAESHTEYNFTHNIILELKKNYVFICYEYDYSHDSYTTRFLVTKDKKFNITDITAKFVNDDYALCEDIYYEYSATTDRHELKANKIQKTVTKVKNNDFKFNLIGITNPFIKKLVFGLSFYSPWYQLPVNKQTEMHNILCAVDEDTNTADTNTTNTNTKTVDEEVEEEETEEEDIKD